MTALRFRLTELTPGRLGAALLRRARELPHAVAWRRAGSYAEANRARLRRFRNRHAGERCVVIGNGPSLLGIDLSRLRHEVTFGTNRIYLLPDRPDLVPTYYVCSNELVLEQFRSDIAALPMPKFLNWNRRALFPRADDSCSFFRIPLELTDRFGTDPERSLSSGGTVTFVALQLAFYLGFRDVVLIGVDHNFVDRGTPNRTAVRSALRDDNHFHPDYFRVVPAGSCPT